MLIFPDSGLRKYRRKIVLLLDGSLGHVEFLPVSKLQLFVQSAGTSHPRVLRVLGVGEAKYRWRGGSMEGYCAGSTVESSAGDLVGCVSRVGVGISVSFVAS